MKNYYEVLEISENASPDVIERVYKLLAKKYHPDLNPDNPKAAEEKFKEISEAYEVLSDETKRKKFDSVLRAERVMKEQEALERNNAQAANYGAYGNQYEISYEDQMAMRQREAQARATQEYQIKKAYNDAYVAALKKMGINVVYKKTWKERIQTFKSMCLTILVFAIIVVAIWLHPYTRNKLINFYENNAPLKSIVDFITRNNEEIDADTFIDIDKNR